MVRIVVYGLHQKAASDDHNDAPESMHGFKIDSERIFYLLKDWAGGGLSASEVQRTAMHAYNNQIHLLKTLGINKGWCMQSMSRMASLTMVLDKKGDLARSKRATFTGIF